MSSFRKDKYAPDAASDEESYLDLEGEKNYGVFLHKNKCLFFIEHIKFVVLLVCVMLAVEKLKLFSYPTIVFFLTLFV